MRNRLKEYKLYAWLGIISMVCGMVLELFGREGLATFWAVAGILFGVGGWSLTIHMYNALKDTLEEKNLEN